MSSDIRLCWLCGNPADSREHKFKKSDLARSSKTWARDDQPFFVGAEGVRRIQGPDSKLATFDKVICQRCNTTRTQPYDRCYECFSNWVSKNGATLMCETSLDFAEIYGPDYRSAVLNLLKYFAKHLGCRIASENYSIPPGFAASMATEELSPFGVSLSRNSQVKGFPVRAPGMLHNFPTIGSYSPSTGEVHAPYLSGMIVGHLDVLYRYDYAQRYSWEGDLIVPSERFARLGEYSSGAAHLSDGQIPGSESSRRFTIGDQEFSVPLLTRDHIQHILSLASPASEKTSMQNLEERFKIVHAILSPFYPEVTVEFLRHNLTLPDSDALWRCVLPSSG
jgi:hypothetical protein